MKKKKKNKKKRKRKVREEENLPKKGEEKKKKEMKTEMRFVRDHQTKQINVNRSTSTRSINNR